MSTMNENNYMELLEAMATNASYEHLNEDLHEDEQYDKVEEVAHHAFF